ncbi:MAG: homing endonuclease associated repeat-containing protein, partial [Blastocatellia bacterium]
PTQLGRPPSVIDIETASKTQNGPGVNTYARAFGGVPAARKAAGIEGVPGRAEIDRSTMIAQIKALAAELNRTPTIKDVTLAYRQEKCVATSMLDKAFGGFRLAILAAGLQPVKRQEFTRAELIAQLKMLSQSLGRGLYKKDVVGVGISGECARLATFKKVFGTLEQAVRSAGVVPVRHKQFTRDELAGQYKALAAELNKLPSRTDIARAARAGTCAGYRYFQKEFENRIELVRWYAGLESTVARKYSDGELLEQLRTLAEKVGRNPLPPEIRAAARNGAAANYRVFLRRFGTYNKALKLAGLAIEDDPNDSKLRIYSDETLKKLLRALAGKLGHRPSHSEVAEACKRRECASNRIYIKRFGSLGAAIHAAGLDSLPVKPPYER